MRSSGARPQHARYALVISLCEMLMVCAWPGEHLFWLSPGSRCRSARVRVSSGVMAAAGCRRLFLSGSVHGLRFGSRTLPVLTRTGPVRQHRLGPADDEMYQRTTVSVMQKEATGGSIIYSYSPRGFNIDGNKVFGPCAVLPPAILQWNVGCHTDITVESLSLFYLIEPRIEILVLGTGARTERLDPNVLNFLRRKGISVEVQDTPNACATFNFLSSERRITAAGLIPPPAQFE